MSKDKNLLLGVSDLFTEETLENIVREVSGENNVKVLSWDFGDASAKGDSYLSTVNRVSVEWESAGKHGVVRLVVKSLPRNLGRVKTYRSAEFFYNETTFYKEVIPLFEEFLKSKGQKDLITVPRSLASVIDGKNDFLALEDVSFHGFGPVSRLNCLTLAQCNTILKSLARFHAVSFALRDQKKEEFQKVSEKLRETYFHSRLWDWYKNFQAILTRVAKDALAREYPGSKGEKLFNSYKTRELFDKSAAFCGRTSAPTSVISQGDAWAPNFLVRGLDPENQEALMLDFQLSRCASPILDISFFIYSCTDKALRDQHFDNLLRTYHVEITKSIALLGSDPEKLYPWSVFTGEVKEQFIHGVTFGLEAIPFSMLDESEAFDLDIIKGEDAIDIAEIWKVQNIAKKEGRCRLAEVIQHAAEKGFL